MTVSILNRVAKLRNRGLSFTQIATKLNISKGVVAGTVFRGRENGDKRFLLKPLKPRKAQLMNPLLNEDLTPPTVTPPVIKRKGVSLVALKPNSCKFPIDYDDSEPGYHLFCAKTTSQTSPYCPRHEEIARAGTPRPKGTP
jgi:hypothetical protein